MLDRVEHVVVVVPIDGQVNEAQHVARENRQQLGQRRPIRSVRNLQLQHHDRDDDRHHTIAEGRHALFQHRCALSDRSCDGRCGSLARAWQRQRSMSTRPAGSRRQGLSFDGPDRRAVAAAVGAPSRSSTSIRRPAIVLPIGSAFSCRLRLLGCAMRLCSKPSLELLSVVLLVFAWAPAAAQSIPVTTKPVRTFEGHTRGIVSVAFSRDGQRIVSGSRDKTVRLWQTATGKRLRTFQGHNEEVGSVAFSPDRRWIASASRDKTIKLWDVSTNVVRTLAIEASRRPIVVVSPDGRFIASADLDGPTNLWDVSTLSLVRTFQTGGGAFSMAFSRDGKWLSANRGKAVSIWEAQTGNLARTLKGHQHNVLSIAFSPDGRSIATASVDDTMKLWDASTGSLIRTTANPGVAFVAFTPDASSLVSASDIDNAF